MDQLISRSKTKKYIKEVAKRTRGGRFTRVAESFIDELESDFRVRIHNKIHRHPSIGKTLMGEE
jgi:hypothetical protein